MNSRKKISVKPIDRVPAEDRITELERQVAALIEDVAVLKHLSGWPFQTEDAANEEKAKPGPKEQIDDVDLFHYRDALILWLEPVWPWLEGRLGGSAEDLRTVLEAVAEDPEIKSDHQRRLLQNMAALHEFLWHERSGKALARTTVVHALTLPWEDERRRRAANQLPTRRIANAMAGVPDIAWRTSLDRCSAQPSEATVAVNLDMHLRERFGIPARNDLDLTGAFCPVPKSLRRVLTQTGTTLETDKPSDLTRESAAGGHENT